MVNIKNKFVIAAALAILSVLLLFIVIYDPGYIYKSVKSERHSGVNYDSHSGDKAQAAAYSESERSDIKKIDLNFRMKVYSIDNYNNVFQTAPANDGIRLELTSPSVLALIVRYKGADKPEGIVLTRTLQLDKWYSVNIRADRDNRLTVLLDESLIVDGDKDLREIDYKISDIAIGTGFSKTRSFDGAISDLTLKYKFFRKIPITRNTVFASKAVLISIWLLVFLYVNGRHRGLLSTTNNAPLIGGLKAAWVSFFILVSVYIIFVQIKFWDDRAFSLKLIAALSLLIPFGMSGYLFRKEDTDAQAVSIYERINRYILLPLFINVGLIVLAYYASYGAESGIKPPFLKIGFWYGNFNDFFNAAWVARRHGILEHISTGYFPFSPLMAQISARLLDWEGKDTLLRNGKFLMVYSIYFLLCVSPVFYMLWDRIIKRVEGGHRPLYAFLMVLFMMTSYPFIFAFERGNYALVSLFFLSLSLIYFERSKMKSVIYLSLFFSIKVLNLVFLLFLFKHYRRRQYILSFGIFVLVQLLSLMLMGKMNVEFILNSFKGMYDAIFASGLVFNDEVKITASSGVEALRTIVYLTYNNITSDIASENRIVKPFLMAAGLISLAFYYLRARGRVNYIEHGMMLLLVPLLFHSNAADYTNMLLVPFTVLYFVSEWGRSDVYVLKFMLATYITMNMFPFHIIGDWVGRPLGGSIKAFIMPVLFAMIIYMIVAKQPDKLLSSIDSSVNEPSPPLER